LVSREGRGENFFLDIPFHRMVCFVNVKSVDRIICSIFQRFTLEWKTRTLNLIYTSGVTSPEC